MVRLLIAFCAVPKDATGRIIGSVELAGGFDVVIEWDLPMRQYDKPLRDWFNKDEYERRLEEVE
jgi:hypothetical protein